MAITGNMRKCGCGVGLHGGAALPTMFLGEVDDGDVGAFACEEGGSGAADTRVAAGDDGGFIFKLAGALVLDEVVGAFEFGGFGGGGHVLLGAEGRG